MGSIQHLNFDEWQHICQYLRPVESMVLGECHHIFGQNRFKHDVLLQFRRALRHCLLPLVPFPILLLDEVADLNKRFGKVVAILSGSIVLQGLLREPFKTTDLDTYCTRSTCPILRKHLLAMQLLRPRNYRSRAHVEEYNDVHHLHSIEVFQLLVEDCRPLIIQLITVRNRLTDVRNVIKFFDFDIVQNYYDGVMPKITSLKAIMFREARVVPGVVPLKSRVKKNGKRGFKFM